MRFSQGSDVVDTSDVEITLTENELPQRPSLPLRPWHVHLELRPEQLVALHRLGFTGGALAWREGMDDWQPLREGAEPPEVSEDSRADAPLAPVTPLAEARRRTQRESSPPPAQGSVARITPFARARANVPHIAGALPVPLVRVRHPLMQPPPIDFQIAKAPLPSFSSDAVASPPPIRQQEALPYATAFEPKPTSVPPLALELPEEAPRRGTSRAVLLGAAALVALSASNGVLASALLWSMRKEPVRAETPQTAARATAQPPAPPLEAAPVSSDRPLSVDQLPLVTSLRASRTATHEGTATAPNARASDSDNEASPGTRRRGRRTTGAALSEAGTPSARKSTRTEKAESAAPSSEPPDRRAVGRAVARAAGSASSCAPGPEKGRVSLTFSPSGNVLSVSLLQGFGDTGINSCVLRSMGRARVRPFSGDPVTVQKTLSW